MSDWTAWFYYAYLAVAACVYLGSSGPRVPRALLGLVWLPMLAAFLVFLLIAGAVMFCDDWISFGPARRTVGGVRRALRRFRHAGGAS